MVFSKKKKKIKNMFFVQSEQTLDKAKNIETTI